MSFTRDIAKWSKKTKSNMVDVRRSVFFQLSENIIKLTPVDTGRAKGNWQPSLHEFKGETIDEDFPGSSLGSTNDQAGKSVMDGVVSVTKRVKGDDTMAIVNNLPYINKLEYGGYGDGPKTSGGRSKQAPRGMVRVTIREFRKALRKAVRGLK